MTATTYNIDVGMSAHPDNATNATHIVNRTPPSLLALPTLTEARACWDLCRLNNNMGCWLTWLPTAWSLVMVYRQQPELEAVVILKRAALYLLLCSGVKSLIMVIDDILDRDVDAQVERTKGRALCRGDISPIRAWIFFLIQCAVGVALAFKYLSQTSLRVSMAVWPLFLIYPTCKRWTNFAPIPLGVMFNVGAFMGWADLSVDGSVAWRTLLPLYLGAFCWTITYETVYQHQDKLEDAKLGMRSLALFLGKQKTMPVCVTAASGFIALVGYSGFLNAHGASFFTWLSVAGAILLSRLARTDFDVPEECLQFFRGMPGVGQIILGGLVLDVVLHRLEAGISL